MKVSVEKWKNWNAVKCIAGGNVLIAGISAGPRILSFSCDGGENILYEDHTDFKVGNWRMYGGHRFTLAPENEDSYYPDNEPCEIRVDNSMLHISAKRRLNGLALSMVISEAPGEGFYIDHILLNGGSNDWVGALWAITCIPRSHVVVGSCETKKINFWTGTDSSKWKQAEGKMKVEDGDFRGKAGWYSATPELNATGEQGAFTISSPGISTPELCVDNNSNVEIFVCANWTELETLSQKFLVTPGGSVSHRQHWQFKPG